LLALEGAVCIPLGTQMPLTEIGRAAHAHQVDIVALSFSAAFPRRQLGAVLQPLRQLLASHVALWAGGAGVAGLVTSEPGQQLLHSFDDAVRALAQWRAAQSPVPSAGGAVGIG
jgi:MerR family transcriptional regulator, light-induced transcriptional regulator